jgi:CBS domain-containing protein
MRIADVLRTKGAAVVTINPDATVTELLAGLAKHNIGAMVVVGPDGVVGMFPSATSYASCTPTGLRCSPGRSRRS